MMETEGDGFRIYFGRGADRVGIGSNWMGQIKDNSEDFYPEQLGTCDTTYWNEEVSKGSI